MVITFDSIGNGGLQEKFNMALRQIGRNILDPNMDPEAAREMTINIKFKPAGRGNLKAEYNVKPKLAGFKKAETMFLVGQDMALRRQSKRAMPHWLKLLKTRNSWEEKRRRQTDMPIIF